MDAKKEFLQEWMKVEEPRQVAERRARQASREEAPAGASEPTLESVEAREIQGAPTLTPFADMDFWYLTRPLTWANDNAKPPRVVVPLGFTTDFASIPSAFWSWMPRTGRYGIPAIVHDWLYWEQAIPRDDADTLFDVALGDLGVPMWRRTIIYRSVWAFGKSYWDGNAAAKARGEGRVLKKFPEDARVTWAEWRTAPGVFA